VNKTGIFKCIFWLNGLLFLGEDDQGFLAERVKSEELSNGTNVAS
jgi:hypothetical protein